MTRENPVRTGHNVSAHGDSMFPNQSKKLGGKKIPMKSTLEAQIDGLGLFADAGYEFDNDARHQLLAKSCSALLFVGSAATFQSDAVVDQLVAALGRSKLKVTIVLDR